VRKRRNRHRGIALGAASIASSLLWLLWARAARRPVDSVAVAVAVAASLIIVINAVILQSGSRSAPFVANAPPPPPAALAPGATLAPPLRAAETPRAPQTAAVPRNDPIAQLINMSSRIMKVQRVLSDYGYGQVRLTGVLDRPTTEAIERFEREHDLPVTGAISDRLMNELAIMAGHPLD
jgi:hypothetical protein